MIYKNLLNLTALADDLITYIESDSEANKKDDTFHALVFLFDIESLFDIPARGLFRDENGFDLEPFGEEYEKVKDQIQISMDKIRLKVGELINKYGKEKFKEKYASLSRKKDWIERI